MSQQEHLFKIECGMCRGVKYLKEVPEVFVCLCTEPRTPGFRIYRCPQCEEVSEIQKGMFIGNPCKICEERNSVKQIGIIREPGRPAKTFQSVRSPADFELEGIKSDATRTTEALEKIVKLLESKEQT